MKFKVAFFAIGISGLLLTLYFTSNGSAKSDDHSSRASHTNSMGVDQNAFTEPRDSIQKPLTPTVTQTSPQLVHSDDVINGDTANNAKQLKSFDDLITLENGKAYMDSRLIEEMDKDQLSSHISNLSSTMTQLRSVGIHERLLADTRDYESDNQDIFIHDMQCSDLICGLMFESTDLDAVNSAVSSISRLSAFRQESKGGTLRVLEEGGVYYGVIIASIDEASLTIR